ncbi:ImpA family type VI secretion system protein [Sphingomonas profundi]|uniref:type VI secretion system protein TssA n=1 Tax=Alterirhizorhabdus profundi TaxID=2681549 RepID=UPI0018D0AC21|nr:type VI secretion system ImpA family N-terminal domain-containing protein [Sphingomonas profundi]
MHEGTAGSGIELLVGEDIASGILAPIDGGAGADGRADEGGPGDDFRELRSQRKQIFRAEQRAAMGEDPGDGDNWSWPMIADAAIAHLVTIGKDLEPMAMVVEASARLDGIDGLDRAINVLADLIEAFWDEGLYPPEDEDEGVEARFQPLSGLSGGGSDKDGTLIMPLRRMVLAGDPSTGELRYLDRYVANTQFATAQNAKTDQLRAPLLQEAEAALTEIEGVARKLSARSLKGAIAALASAEAGWRRGTNFIAERTKPRFPATSKVTDELRGMREWLESLLKFVPEDALPEALEQGEAGVAEAAPGQARAGGPMVLGRIDNRADALRAVAAAAEYFERIEPLSPMGPSLRDIDRRARMSFSKLLEELIPDSDTRETFYWRSGIKPPAEETGEEE